MTRVAVMGSGAWGTAFGKVLADAGAEVALWARRPEIVEMVRDRHENTDYLPGIALPPGLTATTDAKEAAHGAEFVVLAVPSQSLRENLLEMAPAFSHDTVFLSLLKGVELGTAKRMSEVVREVIGVPEDQVAVLTGPNLAREIALEQPAASVVACTDPQVARRLQQTCSTPYFQLYTNEDVVGCELGGAVKNVIALAAGMAEGLGFGDNTKASLITRGLAETARLGVALGADPMTFAGLAGMGDLVATCSSPLSRNRTFGERLGRGETVAQLLATPHQTAEGVKSCTSVLDLAHRHGVRMPITAHVAAVCHDGAPPAEMVQAFLDTEARAE
jgi:glycerol-3-phosphate dehydrogenase (NAD(P)+)